MSPVVVFVPLKPETLFELFRVVPAVELVVSSLPMIRPDPDSLIELPAVRLIAPVVMRLPAFSVTFCPALRFKVPDPLVTSASTRTSLVVDVSVTAPEPLAATIPPIASVPDAVRLIGPFAEAVVTLPVVFKSPI